MSELIAAHDNRAVIRWKFLTSASALALTVCFSTPGLAADVDRPQVWIELGGQFAAPAIIGSMQGRWSDAVPRETALELLA